MELYVGLLWVVGLTKINTATYSTYCISGVARYSLAHD